MTRVSVVVLNYNGAAVVRQCLRSVLALQWRDLEILVVDNASTDESPNHILAEVGDRARLIQRLVNSPTAGRNEGFATSHGEYILSLDNDIVLANPFVLHHAVAILDTFPLVGALAFRIGSPENPSVVLPEHWWHPVSLKAGKDRFFYSDWFAEGAVLFRRSALLTVGGYDEDLFHGFESVDLALRLLDRGFDIMYCPTLTCSELRVRGFHPRSRNPINYLTLRNKLWTVWKDYPLMEAIYYASTRITAGMLQAIRYGWADMWWTAVKEGIMPPPDIRRKRRPVSCKTWKHIRTIRKGLFCIQAEQMSKKLPAAAATTFANMGPLA